MLRVVSLLVIGVYKFIGELVPLLVRDLCLFLANGSPGPLMNFLVTLVVTFICGRLFECLKSRQCGI